MHIFQLTEIDNQTEKLSDTPKIDTNQNDTAGVCKVNSIKMSNNDTGSTSSLRQSLDSNTIQADSTLLLESQLDLNSIKAPLDLNSIKAPLDSNSPRAILDSNPVEVGVKVVRSRLKSNPVEIDGFIQDGEQSFEVENNKAYVDAACSEMELENEKIRTGNAMGSVETMMKGMKKDIEERRGKGGEGKSSKQLEMKKKYLELYRLHELEMEHGCVLKWKYHQVENALGYAQERVVHYSQVARVAKKMEKVKRGEIKERNHVLLLMAKDLEKLKQKYQELEMEYKKDVDGWKVERKRWYKNEWYWKDENVKLKKKLQIQDFNLRVEMDHLRSLLRDQDYELRNSTSSGELEHVASSDSIDGILKIGQTAMDAELAVKYATLQKDYDRIQTECSHAKQKCSMVKSDLSKLRIEHKHLQNQCTQLTKRQTDPSEMEQKCTLTQTNFIELQKMHADLAQQHAMTQIENTKLQTELSDIGQKYTTFEAQYSTLQTKHDNMVQKYATAQIDYSRLQVHCTELEQKNCTIQKENNILQNQLGTFPPIAPTSIVPSNNQDPPTSPKRIFPRPDSKKYVPFK